MNKPPSGKVIVAGAAGMVGSAICRALEKSGVDHVGITRVEADLRDRSQVERALTTHGGDWLVIAAARVGGIHANNTYPADFIYDNLAIETNLVDGAFRSGIERILFLGSSCIYPRDAVQPMSESALLTGLLEPTNEPYAIAKIAGIKLCESYNRQHGTDYRSLMPTNLYGPGDNFHPENSHVIPALLRRFHEAKAAGSDTITVWGSGKPRREFLHVDDLASAALHTMSISRQAFWQSIPERCSHLNVGTGTDVTIAELAHAVRDAVDLTADIQFDTSKPDGTPRKLLNVQALTDLGWQSEINLQDGLADAYRWFVEHAAR